MEKQEFLKALEGLLSIRSVTDRGEGGYVFGKGCHDALGYVIGLCDSFGFRTKVIDDTVGYAEIGEGDELIGILAHLDVVPEGSGWECPPFGLTVKDGVGYGRGIVDDKGPAMLCVFAMKDILDEYAAKGEKPGKRIRIIFGLTEENGEWTDMELYKSREELPTMGFTPDADFPAVYGEKGILILELCARASSLGIGDVSGGTAHNVVPDSCRATLCGKEYAASGVPAHGSTPEKGVNAICALMKAALEDGCESGITRFFRDCFGMTTDGSLMGCALSDGLSGALTLNVGTIEKVGENVKIVIDIRYPVTCDGNAVRDAVAAKCAPYGFTTDVSEHKRPVYKDKNGKLVSALVNAYRKVTGDTSEPFTIGGGTYARAMDNIVAFGPLFPGNIATEHQKNERIPLSDLYKAGEVYKAALEALLDDRG